jgi:hypothetical protein
VTSENFSAVLQTLVNQRPFKIFTIKLRGNQRFEIDHPSVISFQNEIAAFRAPGDVLLFFDHECVNFIAMASAMDVSDGGQQ